jgi:MOB kinase activator 1
MATLGLGNMREAVVLPEGEDLNEWLAVNVVDFYNQLSMIYATITDLCTPDSCPLMRAGRAYTYLWSDGQKYRHPTELSAPVYIGLLMDWVNDQLGNEALFPSAIGAPFPRNFESIIKNIMKRLFRVYAHCYHDHLNQFEELDILKHLNTSFKHFLFFTKEFNLIAQDQLEPLKVIITQMEQQH